MQLRRVVELAGHERPLRLRRAGQRDAAGDGTLRPDMVVRLAGGKNIVVDSKVSLAAYLEAAEAADEAVREARLDAHARHLREHVDRLAAKAYWTALSPAPEFVVLFIPGEAFLAPALEHDPGPARARDRAQGAHRDPDHAGHDAANRAVRLAAGGAVRERPGRVRPRPRALRPARGLGKHVDGLGKALTNAVTATTGRSARWRAGSWSAPAS